MSVEGVSKRWFPRTLDELADVPRKIAQNVSYGMTVFFLEKMADVSPSMVRYFETGSQTDFLQKVRAQVIAEHMQQQTTPFVYEPVQIGYYLRHLNNFLRARSASSAKRMGVDLKDPSIEYFTRMTPEKRSEYITDLDTLMKDAKLKRYAKNVGIAVVEVNGGVGSSMGMDPMLGLSKANGITFRAYLSSNSEGTVDVDISVMEGRLRHHAYLTNYFKSVHVVPFNGTQTEDGWQLFINGESTSSRVEEGRERETNESYFTRQGLTVHKSLVQQGFPLLNPDTLRPVSGDEFNRIVAPGGHGQHFYHTYFSGKLHELADQGVQIVVFTNSDNSNATPNPWVAAEMVKKDIMAGIISTDRVQIDAKGGIFASKNSNLSLYERAQVPKDQMETFESMGLNEDDAPQPFNTNTMYLNLSVLLPYLDHVRETQGEEALHDLLMPETIQNKKSLGDRDDLVHLEGAIGSVVLKLPGVRLFNAKAEDRVKEFTPNKGPIDVVFQYDSDAHHFNGRINQLVSLREGPPPEFTIEGWSGWKNLNKTRDAFGKPSFVELQSLRVYGAVRAPDARFEGRVEIINLSDGVFDLAQDEVLLDEDGRVTLSDVRVIKTQDRQIVYEEINVGDPPFKVELTDTAIPTTSKIDSPLCHFPIVGKVMTTGRVLISGAAKFLQL